MSRNEQLKGNLPSGIQSFKVQVVTHDGELFDVSNNVAELSLYESIYYSYIHGAMTIIDNSMMLADFPFIGQERMILQWTRDDRLFSRVFFVTKVANVSRLNDSTSGYELSLNSVVATRNAVNLFSQSYRGRSDEIIGQIFVDHLGASVTPMDGTQGKTAHNIVFPFIKPLQAVDMVRKNVLADDDTPLFVYDTLYPGEIRLDSLRRMYQRDPILDIKSVKPTNKDSEGQATRERLESRATIYDDGVSRAYDTYDKLNNGVFGSTVTIADPSTREYDFVDFDYKQHAPSLAQDWISDDYRVHGEAPNDIKSTRNLYLPRNALAFNDDLPNLNTIDDLDRSILNSYVRRHATTVVKVYMDSIAYTLENDDPFTVGQTVDYKLLKFMPRLSKGDEELDLVNSGKHIISAIRHYIKNDEYTMSIELIRDGIGERAELTRR